MTDRDTRVLAFTEALEALMKEHGVRIVDGSCGCCGHTALIDATTREELDSVDNWDKETPFWRLFR